MGGCEGVDGGTGRVSGGREVIREEDMRTSRGEIGSAHAHLKIKMIAMHIHVQQIFVDLECLDKRPNAGLLDLVVIQRQRVEAMVHLERCRQGC